MGCEKIQEGLSLRYTHLSRELRSRSIKAAGRVGITEGSLWTLRGAEGLLMVTAVGPSSDGFSAGSVLGL
jgi:hypothetical protein